MAEATYVRRVERILYSFQAIMAGMENEIELEREGLGNLFPAMVASYGGTGGGRPTEVSRPTEKYGILRAEKSLQVRQIQRALSALTNKERELVDNKYFDPYMPPDPEVYRKMGLGPTAFYQLKTQVLRKIATALNII